MAKIESLQYYIEEEKKNGAEKTPERLTKSVMDIIKGIIEKEIIPIVTEFEDKRSDIDYNTYRKGTTFTDKHSDWIIKAQNSINARPCVNYDFYARPNKDNSDNKLFSIIYFSDWTKRHPEDPDNPKRCYVNFNGLYETVSPQAVIDKVKNSIADLKKILPSYDAELTEYFKEKYSGVVNELNSLIVKDKNIHTICNSDENAYSKYADVLNLKSNIVDEYTPLPMTDFQFEETKKEINRAFSLLTEKQKEFDTLLTTYNKARTMEYRTQINNLIEDKLMPRLEESIKGLLNMIKQVRKLYPSGEKYGAEVSRRLEYIIRNYNEENRELNEKSHTFRLLIETHNSGSLVNQIDFFLSNNYDYCANYYQLCSNCPTFSYDIKTDTWTNNTKETAWTNSYKPLYNLTDKQLSELNNVLQNTINDYCETIDNKTIEYAKNIAKQYNREQSVILDTNEPDKDKDDEIER